VWGGGGGGARSDTYVEVRADSERALYNRVTGTLLTGVSGTCLMGEVVA